MVDASVIPELPPQCIPTRDSSDEAWMLAQCFKIMMMQAGFAVVESSFVRQKNSANIMMKNTVDLALGALLYWAFGYALAYGVDPNDPTNVNPFCGTGQFFLIQGHDAANWMFQLSFAATAATIDSGAVAERMQFIPYLLYSGFMTSLFYPIVCHWCWDAEGWLGNMGFHDFAGSGPVHLMGGASSLVAAWYIGPRLGRFADKGELEVTVVQGMDLDPKHKDSKPYVVVRQLNHGSAEKETRTADDGAHPLFGTKVTFDVVLEDETGPLVVNGVEQAETLEGEVSVMWSTLDDWNAKDRDRRRSKHGTGASMDDPSVDVSGGSGIVTSLMNIFTSDTNGSGKRAGRRSLEMSNASRIAPAPSLGAQLLSGGSVTWILRLASIKKHHLELRSPSKCEKVHYSLIDKVEDWGEKNLLIHMRDLRVLEMALPSTKDRDAWLFRLLHSWRPTVSAQRLAIILVDEVSDQMIGEGKMTVYAVDKPDPEKFKIKTFVALSTGGKIEVDAAYTSPQRMTREIFQACDPNKLLFGTFLLWINWYSFNSGSTTAISGGGIKLASIVAVNTTLAACAGGVFSMLWSMFWTGAMMVEPMATGILGGLVGICASCDVVSQWESIIIGTMAAFFSINTVDVINHLRIDDPCAATAIHMASGLWGVIAVGLFARPELCMGGADIVGLFHGGGGKQLGVQCLAALTIIVWSFGCCYFSFAIMSLLSRFKPFHALRLRPTRAEEMIGFDQSEHNIFRQREKDIDPVLVEANAPVKLKGRSKWTKVTVKSVLKMSVTNVSKGSDVPAASSGSNMVAGVAKVPRELLPLDSGFNSDLSSGDKVMANAGKLEEESVDDMLSDLQRLKSGSGSQSQSRRSKLEIFNAAADVFTAAPQVRKAVDPRLSSMDGDITPAVGIASLM